MFSNSVFNRNSGYDLISKNVYNLIIGLTLLWGFVINAVIVAFVPTAAIAAINPWIFFIGYFALALGGCYIFSHSDEPIISFLGYNMVVVPFGFVLNLIVSQYEPGLVLNALITTAIVTGIMMFLGILYPDFFENIFPALTIALIAVIIVEFVMILITGHSSTWIDWIVALIFCGYIGYDWHRANSISCTVDNAIDSAASLYMDIINLFIRILSIMGNSRR